jgi:hypothetical protein
MQKFDEEKLKKLLNEGNKDGAKQYLESILSLDWSEEKAETLLFELSMVYMKIMNEINETEKEQLEDILADLKEFKRIDKTVNDAVGLAKVRQELSQ